MLWFFKYKSPWDAFLESIEAKLGETAAPFKAFFADKYQLLEDLVLKESPILNQEGEVFKKMIKAEVAEKLQKIIFAFQFIESQREDFLIHLKKTPENKDNSSFNKILQDICDFALDEKNRFTEDGRHFVRDKEGKYWMHYNEAHLLPKILLPQAGMEEVDEKGNLLHTTTSSIVLSFIRKGFR